MIKKVIVLLLGAMKKLAILLILLFILTFVPGVMACSSGGEQPTAKPTPVPTYNPALPILKLEVSASTWREGKKPYDIRSAIKQRLQSAGFRIVESENPPFDVTLRVDYIERQGPPYYERGNDISTGFGEFGGYGTNIGCGLALIGDIDIFGISLGDIGGTFDIIWISGSTHPWVASNELYSSAVKDFESDVYFNYLGGFLSAWFGVGDEVSVLILALSDKDEDVRLNAIDELQIQYSKETRVVEPLILTLSKDQSYQVRLAVAEALGKTGDARAVEPLIQVLLTEEVTDPDSLVRGAAAEALGKIGDARAVEPLIQGLRDTNMIVREYSAKALAAIGDTRAVEPLIRALQDNEIVRREAANALNYIGDTRAVEPLIALLLNDYDSQVRQAAATALGSIGDTRAVEPLTQALEDADALVRDAARDALNKIKRGSE